jgi:hypothetical protein
MKHPVTVHSYLSLQAETTSVRYTHRFSLIDNATSKADFRQMVQTFRVVAVQFSATATCGT